MEKNGKHKMNRTDGLVRRVKNRESNDGLNSNSVNQNAENEENNGATEDSIEDCDSKETRLTLMEEVLLLGLKDKEVSKHGLFSRSVVG